MAHLAAGTRLGLAVEMQHQIGFGEQGCPRVGGKSTWATMLWAKSNPVPRNPVQVHERLRRLSKRV